MGATCSDFRQGGGFIAITCNSIIVCSRSCPSGRADPPLGADAGRSVLSRAAKMGGFTALAPGPASPSNHEAAYPGERRRTKRPDTQGQTKPKQLWLLFVTIRTAFITRGQVSRLLGPQPKLAEIR